MVFDRRRAHQLFSSGDPHENRTYLPRRTCGIGSAHLERVCSRTQDSGTRHRSASSSAVNTSKNGPAAALLCSNCSPRIICAYLSMICVVWRFTKPSSKRGDAALPPRRSGRDGASGYARLLCKYLGRSVRISKSVKGSECQRMSQKVGVETKEIRLIEFAVSVSASSSTPGSIRL